MEKIELETLNHPFFVVGPVRSGTTLLRLLIDHHPEVSCFGEFEGAVSQANGDEWPDLDDYYRFIAMDRQTQAYAFSVNRRLGYEALVHSFLRQQLERYPNPLIGASVHSRMDLLPRLWPQAKFIHLLRDPRDVARSCIRMGWVGNVYEGAQYWVDAERRWDRLARQVGEEQCMTIRYEELVVDPEQELARVCQFLGLDYSASMLKIESDTTYSRPNNKYANQWKKELSAKEVEWVEARCGDLMTARGYQATQGGAKDLSPLRKMALKLQSRWYRAGFGIKRHGFKNWLLYVLSKRVGPGSFKASMQSVINDRNRKLLK